MYHHDYHSLSLSNRVTPSRIIFLERALMCCERYLDINLWSGVNTAMCTYPLSDISPREPADLPTGLLLPPHPAAGLALQVIHHIIPLQTQLSELSRSERIHRDKHLLCWQKKYIQADKKWQTCWRQERTCMIDSWNFIVYLHTYLYPSYYTHLFLALQDFVHPVAGSLSLSPQQASNRRLTTYKGEMSRQTY